MDGGAAMGDILAVENVSKQIQEKIILGNISFTAVTGDLIAITGPNGAGKTTLLRMIAGLMTVTAGRILWNQEQYGLEHGRIGYLSHQPMLYDSLSVLENLSFFAKLYNCYSPQSVQEILTRVGLWLARYEPAAVLSRGMQQRLAIARTLVSTPRLILYDEPFTGLDREGRELLLGLLAENQPRTVQVLVTHDLTLLDGLKCREIKIECGKMVEEGVASD